MPYLLKEGGVIVLRFCGKDGSIGPCVGCPREYCGLGIAEKDSLACLRVCHFGAKDRISCFVYCLTSGFVYWPVKGIGGGSPLSWC